MRNRFGEQLERLHVEMIQMGALCEDAISAAAQALMKGDEDLARAAGEAEREIDQKEREVENLCLKLLLQQQLQAEVLHLPLLLVDLPLRLPGGACQVLVTLHQGLGRGRDGILTQGAHLDHFHVQPLQLLAKSVSHLTSLLSRTGR